MSHKSSWGNPGDADRFAAHPVHPVCWTRPRGLP